MKEKKIFGNNNRSVLHIDAGKERNPFNKFQCLDHKRLNRKMSKLDNDWILIAAPSFWVEDSNIKEIGINKAIYSIHSDTNINDER